MSGQVNNTAELKTRADVYRRPFQKEGKHSLSKYVPATPVYVGKNTQLT